MLISTPQSGDAASDVATGQSSECLTSPVLCASTAETEEETSPRPSQAEISGIINNLKINFYIFLKTK
jgi:hypothetical protein